MELVLASKSESRKAMLDAAGIAFSARPAHVDERAIEAELGAAPAAEVATALAEAKARAVSAEEPHALVLGSDSLVTVAGRRFDKPGSCAEAAAHLAAFSGQRMDLHSAAALAHDGRVLWRGSAVASLQVRELSNEFIRDYLEAEWPAVAACVGVFRIEGRGVQLFERIDGDQFTVLGMPLLQVLAALRELGELAA
jgi:septum formation protein